MADGTAAPVITGLVVGIAFVAVFALLFANPSSTLIQDDGQISPTIGGIKGGYIDPERKAQLESVELDLRQRVSELGFDAYAVNLNSQTKTIEVVTNDPTKNDQVRALFVKYPSDIPIELTNADLTIADFDGGIFKPDASGDQLNDEVYQFAFKP